MQTTNQVVLDAYSRAIQRVSKFVKSTAPFWLFLLGLPFLSKAQITFSSPGLPIGLEFTEGGVSSVQVGDLNGDGYPDIIYITSTGGGITYLQSNAGTSFSTPAVNPFAAFINATSTGVTLTNAHLADFDRDGDLDLWVPVANATDFYLRNDGNVFTSISLPTGMEFTGIAAGSIKVADINGDGYPDIILNAAPAGGITYLQNNGGSFSIPATNPFATFMGSSPAGTVFTQICDIADYDGDGDLDVWVRLTSATDVYLQNNAGTYVIGSVPTGMEFTGAGAGAVKVADFNGDGLVDILYQTAAGSGITYLQNNLGSFAPPTPNPFSAFSTSTPTGTVSNASMTIADFDRDGDLDIWGRNSGAAADFYAINTSTPPRLVSSIPAHNAVSVVRSTNITMTFSKAVFTGTGSLQIRRISDNSIVESIAATGPRVTGSGTSTIVVDPVTTLASTTGYYLTFNRTALADELGIIPGGLNQITRMPASSPDFLSFTTSAALPVTFGNITAVLGNGVLTVDWNTMTESSNDHFEIEASADGKSFTVIGKTDSKAINGNASTPLSYNFTQEIPVGFLGAGIFLTALAGLHLKSRRKQMVFSMILIGLTGLLLPACNKQNEYLADDDSRIYIRIAQVDKDGTKSYSKTVSVIRE